MEKILSGQNLAEGELKQKRFKKVEKAYGRFLEALGYDWEKDPNMEGTPKRVAKMYLSEITKGTYDPKPRITSFPNQEGYTGMVFTTASVFSLCSHHIKDFTGKAYVAYLPGDKVIGLSKINRIVDWFSRRPQLQEQLTQQIHDELNKLLVGNKGVAVYIEAVHSCVTTRGISDHNGGMTTSFLSGEFKKGDSRVRNEFYSMINKTK